MSGNIVTKSAHLGIASHSLVLDEFCHKSTKSQFMNYNLQQSLDHGKQQKGKPIRILLSLWRALGPTPCSLIYLHLQPMESMWYSERDSHAHLFPTPFMFSSSLIHFSFPLSVLGFFSSSFSFTKAFIQ